MRKTEVRWVSRDDDGRYDVWRNEPQKNKVGEWWGGVFNDDPLDIHSATIVEKILAISLRKGHLAKITIERQY